MGWAMTADQWGWLTFVVIPAGWVVVGAIRSARLAQRSRRCYIEHVTTPLCDFCGGPLGEDAAHEPDTGIAVCLPCCEAPRDYDC